MNEYLQELVALFLKYKLSANQFIFMYLKLIKKDEHLYRYLETARPLSRNEINDLEERGFITNINTGANDYWADGYIVTDRFKKIMEPDRSLAEEFWNTYPGFGLINNQRAPLKGVSKSEFLQRYAMYVRNNEVLHERIMRALRFQKGKEEITIRIDRWFEAHTWESVEQELEQIRKKVYGQDEI